MDFNMAGGVAPYVDFIFQINSTRTAREEDLSVVLFYERFPPRRQLLSEGTLDPEVCPVRYLSIPRVFFGTKITLPGWA